jgi:hypothetical protein
MDARPIHREEAILQKTYRIQALSNSGASRGPSHVLELSNNRKLLIAAVRQTPPRHAEPTAIRPIAAINYGISDDVRKATQPLSPRDSNQIIHTAGVGENYSTHGRTVMAEISNVKLPIAKWRPERPPVPNQVRVPGASRHRDRLSVGRAQVLLRAIHDGAHAFLQRTTLPVDARVALSSLGVANQ